MYDVVAVRRLQGTGDADAEVQDARPVETVAPT